MIWHQIGNRIWIPAFAGMMDPRLRGDDESHLRGDDESRLRGDDYSAISLSISDAIICILPSISLTFSG